MDLLDFGYCPYLGEDSIAVKSLCICVFRHFVLMDIERIIGHRYCPVNIFGFCKHLKGNIWKRLKNDGYENHL